MSKSGVWAWSPAPEAQKASMFRCLLEQTNSGLRGSPGTSAHLPIWGFPKELLPQNQGLDVRPLLGKEGESLGFQDDKSNQNGASSLPFRKEMGDVMVIKRVFSWCLLFLNSGLFMYPAYPDFYLLNDIQHYLKLPVIMAMVWHGSSVNYCIAQPLIQYGEPTMV